MFEIRIPGSNNQLSWDEGDESEGSIDIYMLDLPPGFQGQVTV